jgi:hypothetical protein
VALRQRGATRPEATKASGVSRSTAKRIDAEQEFVNVRIPAAPKVKPPTPSLGKSPPWVPGEVPAPEGRRMSKGAFQDEPKDPLSTYDEAVRIGDGGEPLETPEQRAERLHAGLADLEQSLRTSVTMAAQDGSSTAPSDEIGMTWRDVRAMSVHGKVVRSIDPGLDAAESRFMGSLEPPEERLRPGSRAWNKRAASLRSGGGQSPPIRVVGG